MSSKYVVMDGGGGVVCEGDSIHEIERELQDYVNDGDMDRDDIEDLVIYVLHPSSIDIQVETTVNIDVEDI